MYFNEFLLVDTPITVEITGPIKDACIKASSELQRIAVRLFHAGHQVMRTCPLHMVERLIKAFCVMATYCLPRSSAERQLSRATSVIVDRSVEEPGKLRVHSVVGNITGNDVVTICNVGVLLIDWSAHYALHLFAVIGDHHRPIHPGINFEDRQVGQVKLYSIELRLLFCADKRQ